MKQVLLVEDDPLIGQTLSLSLPYRGFSIVLADTIA
jgi:DNA-binding response OmpR family regulator